MFAIKIFYFIIIFAQVNSMVELDSCSTKSTCKECIMDPHICVWCAMNDFNGTRCRPNTFDEENWCPKDLLQNLKNLRTPIVDKPFNSSRGHVIQIKPQNYKLSLRPGLPLDFNFSFKGAKNFPVDIYFLIDASRSMDSVKTKTVEQSEYIYLTLKNLTTEVRLGLGTFVDKRLYPYTNTFNKEKTYSYKHHLKLTDNYKEFKDILSNITYGHNRDNPEGGLDALAQVMSCKHIVGWREESRKIIVYLSDDTYHAAGDGKSAGIFEPYDGKCYTEDNIYTKELIMDYPSVGIINRLAFKNDIIILFLVESKVSSVYQELSAAVSGSKFHSYVHASLAKYDSITRILEDVYKEISHKIKLKVINSKDFVITIKPDCTKKESTSECEVLTDEEIQFTGTIKLKQYVEQQNNIIQIMVQGFNAKLNLDVELIKSCDCEKTIEENSQFCHGETRECGICKCSNKRYGERCRCEKSGNSPVSDNSTCISTGSNNTICGGRGSCICGVCNCRKGYVGKYCECNMNTCGWDEYINDYCNGHGECVCGKCVCDHKWAGDLCDCDTSTVNCEVTEGNVCNNRGRCNCGTCVCDQIAQWDMRTDQDDKCRVNNCTDCHALQCSILKTCAYCQLQENSCAQETCPEEINVILKDELSDNYLNSTNWNICNETRIKVGCYTKFVYRYTDSDYGIEMILQKKLNCAETYWISGAICLGILLLIGVSTLIAWKLLNDARDRKEYMNFSKQNKELLFDPVNNPLYERPTSCFSNPAFRRPSAH